MSIVMDCCAYHLRQDANGIHGQMPSFLVQLIVGKSISTGHMQPVKFATSTQTCFIEMHDCFLLL